MKRLVLSVLVGTALLMSVAAFADTTGMPAMPPNIQKIMQKLQTGQPTTAADKKALAAWSESMMGIKPGSSEANAIDQAQQNAPQGQVFEVGASEGQNPCHKTGKAIGLMGAVPSRDAYVAMAKGAIRVYGTALNPGDLGKLNTLIAKSPNPSYGGDLSLMLIAGGNGAAGVISAATAAQKNPTDPVTANNLGAALRGMHDYIRAAIALRYAHSLVPDSPVIANNLGWLAMSQGDSNAAGGFFKAAVQKNGQMSASLAGQGLIAQCGGHPQQALPLFRASIRAGFSDLAEAGIQSAEDDISSAKGGGNIGSPDAYGAQGSSASMPDWQDPTFPTDPGQFNTAASQQAPNGPFFKYENYWAQQIASGQHGEIKRAQTTLNGNTLTFTRGYDKEDFVLGDIRRMLSAIMDKPTGQFVAAIENARKQAGCNSCSGIDPNGLERVRQIEACVFRPRAITAHQGLIPQEAGTWTELRKDFSDLYAFSQPWLQQIKDQGTRNQEQWETVETVAAHGSAFAGAIPVWGQEFVIDYNQAKCGGGGSPREKPKPIKNYKIDPTQCHSGSMALNFGAANLRADCEHMVLTMGEGLVFAGELKFAPDYTTDANGVMHPAQGWGNDQLTIFVGAGAAGSGPLTGNVAAGGFVTIQNGNMVDYGGQAQAGVTVGNGDATPATWQGGATARVGAVSGVDVSTSGGVRVGGNCGVSC